MTTFANAAAVIEQDYDAPRRLVHKRYIVDRNDLMGKILILFLCLSLTLASCDRSHEIVAGYTAVELDDGSVLLTKGSLVVIQPHVAKYRTIDHYIIGRRVKPFDPELLSSSLGYFIINTRTGELRKR